MIHFEQAGVLPYSKCRDLHRWLNEWCCGLMVNEVLASRGGSEWYGGNEAASGDRHHSSSTCPFGRWPTNKSGLDGPLCALHCIICLLSSLLESCSLRPTKEVEGPYVIETNSKDQVPRKACPWLPEVFKGSPSGSGCVDLQNHLEF